MIFTDPTYTILGMSLSGWTTIGVVLAAFFFCAFTRYKPELIFTVALVFFMLTGILDTEAALEGFSNAGMITVGVLYIVVTGVKQTGGLEWISHNVLGYPKGRLRAMARMTLPVFGLSAFLNNTPVVAMFIPVVSKWTKKLQLSPSKFMIPLSYAAVFGGLCTLIGTSTNLVVNGMIISHAEMEGLGLFDITWVSLPCGIIGLIYLIFISHKLLPERKPAIVESRDSRQYSVEMIVEEKSPLSGTSIEKAGLRHLPGLFLAEIHRGSEVLPAVGPEEKLREGDRLIFVGIVDSIVDLKNFRGLKPATNQVFKLDTPEQERTLIEAVVSDACPLIGKSVREGKFRSRYRAVILAVARNGERIKKKIGDIVLIPGDALLLEAHSSFLDRQRLSRDFYLVSGVPDSEPVRHNKAPIALGILALMVILAGTGLLSMLKAAMLAAVLMILTDCCSMNRAGRSINFRVLVVIAAALGLGRALQESGAADFVAGKILNLAGNKPWASLAMVYIMTNIFAMTITHIPAAATVFPVALKLSQTLDVSFIPFTIVIMIAASASFATPIGYQTNLMVYGPGGYYFRDFTRVGLPLNIIFGIIAVSLAPLVYPF